MFASLDDATDIRIVDFGLAEKLTNPMEKLFRKCGSAGYTSPELLRGHGYSFSTDVFSVGVILAEMITGRIVFKGRNPNSVFRKIANYDVKLPEDVWSMVSPEARDLVESMITEDPSIRVTASQALEHPWLNQQIEESNEERKDMGLIMSRSSEIDKHMLQLAKFSNPFDTSSPVMAGFNNG